MTHTERAVSERTLFVLVTLSGVTLGIVAAAAFIAIVGIKALMLDYIYAGIRSITPMSIIGQGMFLGGGLGYLASLFYYASEAEPEMSRRDAFLILCACMVGWVLAAALCAIGLAR